MRTFSLRLLMTGVFVILSYQTISAQSKKQLTPADYALWERLISGAVSSNGEWVTYYLMKEDKDGERVVVGYLKSVKNDSTVIIYSGKSVPFGSSAASFVDSTWCISTTSYDDPDPKLSLINLETGKRFFIPGVFMFSITTDGKFLAAQGNKDKERNGKGLGVILDLLNDKRLIINNVVSFQFNSRNDRLAYITDTVNFRSVGLIDLSTFSDSVIASCDSTSDFNTLVWQKNGKALVFCQSIKDSNYQEENQKICYYTNIYSTPVWRYYDPRLDKSFPDRKRVARSYNYLPVVSDDGQTIFFYATTQKQKDTTSAQLATVTGANPVIWHYLDKMMPNSDKYRIVERQNKQAPPYKLYVWLCDENKTIRVEGEERSETSVLLPGQKKILSGNSNRYEPLIKDEYLDCYLTDVGSGTRKLILEKLAVTSADIRYVKEIRPSPDGNFITYYKNEQWYVYDIEKDKHIAITTGIGYPLFNVNHDQPNTAAPYGIAGWTVRSKEIVIHDQFDLWSVSVDGKQLRRLTHGREKKIRYRFFNINFFNNGLSFEDRYLNHVININEGIYLTVFNELTKESGYGKWTSKAGVSDIVFENKAISRLVKAEKAEAYIYMSQDYEISPILMYTSSKEVFKKLVVTNLQQKDFWWGKSELINYTDARGKPLQAVLYYPANYRRGMKYPMIVNIYEKLSGNLHNYVNPSVNGGEAGGLEPNISNYTSDGYFVLQPDITYKLNEIGPSAVNCVVLAVEQVLKTGMIDRKKIGLIGHSFGGFETCYIITRTGLFSAAIAASSLTDPMLFSLGIRAWDPRKWAEGTQGRFTGPWYEQYAAYKNNSPLYKAKNIKTPLLMAVGDADQNTDWRQSLLLYNTMTRMGKTVVLVAYEGESHTLEKKENRMDFTVRQKQWFDHFLLGKEAPRWISNKAN